MLTLLLTLATAPVSAEEIVLRNDTNFDDTYQPGEAVIWLEYPECVISILTPEEDDYPLEIHTIQMFFVSNTGNLEGQDGLTELGIQLVDTDTAPDSRGDWVWGEEAFTTTASSSAINELYLEDPDAGWENVTIEEGSLAVWICPADPLTGADWPYTDSNDVTGVVVDSGSPNANNYVWYNNDIYALSDLGVNGSWIVRAVAGESAGDDGGDDGGSGDGGSGEGSGDDGGDADIAVYSVSPGSIMVGESTSVAIVGEGFDEDASAYIGGLMLSSSVVSGDAALTGTVPATLPVGSHDVVVANPNGEDATLPAGFVVLASEDVDGGSGCGCSGGNSAALAPLFLVPLIWTGRRRREE